MKRIQSIAAASALVGAIGAPSSCAVPAPALVSSTASSSAAPSSLAATVVQRRAVMIRPQGTVDPIRFPLGYISLSGKESVETVYEMVKDGHYVVADRTLEVAHNTLKGISSMLDKEHPVATLNDAVFLQNKKKEILGRILIRRDFWSYEDFNDPRMNQSYGMQNIYFDNYQWSQHLWPQFQTFAEKWFPSAEHSHLTYREYVNLIMYFAAAVKGVMMRPLLPPAHRIKPPFGVPYPSKAAREPIMLYNTWLQYFRAPLMINKALVVRGGCGVLGMTTRLKGVPMVRVCDPSPIAMDAARADAERFGYFYRNMSFMTAEMFPPMPSRDDLVALQQDLQNGANTAHGNLQAVKAAITKHRNYNLIAFNADMPILRGLTDGDPDYHFAPGLQGYTKQLEQFFEQADKYLDKHGVLAISCTNLYNLAYPDRPNPIEYEIKVNRRWVLMDYYDRPMKGNDIGGSFDQWNAADLVGADKSMKNLQQFKGKLRSELWILHKVDSLEEFGWIHGVPGAKAPSHVAKFWKRKTMRQHRLAMMKQQVELSGQDWGEYKSRMLRVLQENAGEGGDRDDMEVEGEPEDDEAAQIRMAMDPTYPMVLARRARRSMAKKEAARNEFHARVHESFIASEVDTDADDADVDLHSSTSSSSVAISPREDYDRWARDVAATLKAQREGRLPSSSASIIGTVGGRNAPMPAMTESPYVAMRAKMARGQQQQHHHQYERLQLEEGGRGPHSNEDDDEDDMDPLARQRFGSRSA